MKLLMVLILSAFGALPAFAQTTEFNYQGRLLENNLPPTAAYDFEFRLYDAENAGTLVGTLARPGVSVTNGVFSVALDFGNQFPGASRFLEIALKPAGNTGGYQQLLPRQAISSTPYAIRSLISTNAENASNASNAAQLGGIAANQYVVTTDARLSDDRNPRAGSSNYVQNTTSEQAAANFNIAGNGSLGGLLSANIVNSATVYNIAGNRVIAIGAGDLIADSSIFVGFGAGGALLGGDNNSVFGKNAGASNISGRFNSFFGEAAGYSSTGSFNSFFGMRAGMGNSTGKDNAFFGMSAGFGNTTGSDNSFFGAHAGSSNAGAEKNSFFGASAGYNNTGQSNSFFGERAGFGNTTGIQNSIFGREAGYNSIGSNNVFIGYQSGFNSTSAFFNVFIGTFAGNTNTTGGSNTIIGNNADVGVGNLTFATAVGAGAIVSTNNTIVLGRPSGADKIRIFGLGAAGSTPLCRNANNEIATCASSLAGSTVDTALRETVRRQAEQIKRQQILIDGLMTLVCQQNQTAAICREQ